MYLIVRRARQHIEKMFMSSPARAEGYDTPAQHAAPGAARPMRRPAQLPFQCPPPPGSCTGPGKRSCI